MYITLTLIEQCMLACLLVAALFAANDASKLIYSPSEQSLHQKALRLRRIIALAAIPAGIAVAADILVIFVAQPAVWGDRLLLRMPLAAAAALYMLLAARPRLRLLVRRTAGQGKQPLDLPRRRHATEPSLVAACKLSALGAAGACYYALFPPVPFRFASTFIPLVALLVLGLIIWSEQNRQSQKACQSADITRYGPWRRRLRLSGIIGAVMVVAGVPVLAAMESSKLGNAAGLPEQAAAGASVSLPKFLSAEGNAKEAAVFDREYRVVLDNRLAFSNGVPNFYDTLNGKVLPHDPLLTVREGELIKTTIVNRSSSSLPLRLHGHSLTVLSLNGKTVGGDGSGSERLEIEPGDVCIVSFRADNPGSPSNWCGLSGSGDRKIDMLLLYEDLDDDMPHCQTNSA